MNEFSIYIICLHHILFLNTAIPDSLIDILGYLVIIIASLSIFANLSLAVKDTFYGLYAYAHEEYHKHKSTKELNRLYALKAKLLKEFPNRFQDLQHSEDYLKATKYCREWIPHRKWLTDNKVNFSKSPEEVQFQEYITNFDFAS